MNPGRAGLLVAAPQMVDPHFSRAVVLLCDFNAEGAVGIVVSRRSPVVRDQILAQLGIAEGGPIEHEVLWGGPVQPGAIFLTFQGGRPPEAGLAPTFELHDRLHVSPARTVIAAIARDAQRAPAFLSLGYAGWGAGQLDEEIRTGSWIVMDLDPDELFAAEATDRWDLCVASLGVAPEQMWTRPIDE